MESHEWRIRQIAPPIVSIGWCLCLQENSLENFFDGGMGQKSLHFGTNFFFHCHEQFSILPCILFALFLLFPVGFTTFNTGPKATIFEGKLKLTKKLTSVHMFHFALHFNEEQPV